MNPIAHQAVRQGLINRPNAVDLQHHFGESYDFRRAVGAVDQVLHRIAAGAGAPRLGGGQLHSQISERLSDGSLPGFSVGRAFGSPFPVLSGGRQAVLLHQQLLAFILLALAFGDALLQQLHIHAEALHRDPSHQSAVQPHLSALVFRQLATGAEVLQQLAHHLGVALAVGDEIRISRWDAIEATVLLRQRFQAVGLAGAQQFLPKVVEAPHPERLLPVAATSGWMLQLSQNHRVDQSAFFSGLQQIEAMVLSQNLEVEAEAVVGHQRAGVIQDRFRAWADGFTCSAQSYETPNV